MTITSYAQNFEDIMLWRALCHIEGGYYIDIGAQDPVIDSVSLAFYEQGWRGIHVEPNAAYAEQLRKARPDETVIEAAVSNSQDKIDFFVIPDTGLSTGDAEIAAHHKEAGFPVNKTEVSVVPLHAIFEQVGERDIHWLKIDVEGMEPDVIKSWLPSAARPWIVVVESTEPLTETASKAEWESSLLALGYEFVYFDGLNRFYVSENHLELRQHFGAPPNVFDDAMLGGESNTPLNAYFKEIRNSFLEKVAATETDLQSARAATKRSIREVDGLRRNLEVAEQNLESQRLENARAIAAATARVLKSEEEATRQRRVAEQNEAENLVLRSKARAAENAVAVMRASNSWRATAPFRLVGDLVRSFWRRVWALFHRPRC